MPIKNPKDRKKYEKEYNKSYKRKPRTTDRKKYYKQKEFLCFDGETQNNNYTLLGNSENYIYDIDGLSSWDCFQFLWNEGKGKIKIIFALHFDIQFWIKDFSDEMIIDLLNGEDVYYYSYKLRYFTKKFLMITKVYNGKSYGTIYIYDIISFFQTSFLKTVELMQLDLTTKELKVLEQGKLLRGKNFKQMSTTQIILYNKTECIVCEKVADKLRNILLDTEFNYNGKTFNLYPKRFYGSGAIAKQILKNLEFEKHAEKEKKLNKSIREFIYMSYYGGRFEVFKVGTFKNIFKYDINSAYPYVMNNITIPESFKIKNYKKALTKVNFINTNIYLIEWNFENADSLLIGVLPYRRKDGYVLFPKKGKGYYFGIECKYLNDLQKKTIGYYKVTKELEVKMTDKKLFPDGFINELYNKRLEFKNKNDVSQIAYKLALNSLYGKLAQQTGFQQFTNLFTASYITASCRSQIMEVIIKNNAIKNVIQISTDGIFLDKELKNINISKKLGDWDFEKYKKAQILGSGIYSLEGGKTIKYALRGIEVTEDNFNKILEKLKYSNKAEIYYTCFIGHKFALANHILYLEYRLKFTEIKKSVSLYNYEKRFYNKQNGINKISLGHWVDIFNGGKVEMTNKLKKFDELLLLENEAISLETK